MTIVKTALAYFAIVFVAGFALGTLRTLWLAPALGATPAVMIELPIMLAISWLTCGWLIRYRPEQPSTGQRAAIGLIALSLLLLVEYLFATLLFAQSARAYFDALMQPAGLLGLFGQLLFGAFPLVRQCG